MINLKRSYIREIESAYIITLKGNTQSEKQSLTCQQSCETVGQKYKVWQAFDGTDNTQIQIPPQCQNASWLPWFKVMDHHLSISEIACVFSHLSLWAHCMEIDKPIVILEHDAVMVQKLEAHGFYNSIQYLGSLEQKQGQFPIISIPPHGTLNHNYHMICRAHAYAIDPAVATQLFTHVLKHGIHESLDVMIRPDLFSIVQNGFYAYDDFQATTITNRKKDIHGQER